MHTLRLFDENKCDKLELAICWCCLSVQKIELLRSDVDPVSINSNYECNILSTMAYDHLWMSRSRKYFFSVDNILLAVILIGMMYYPFLQFEKHI